jgi:acetyl esterase
MRKLADNHDVVCASVEYHVSPEVRYPAALEECAAGIEKVLEHFGKAVDNKRVFFAGDSAGGNLAASLCMYVKNKGSITPKGQVLLYPSTQMETLETESFSRKEWEFSGMRKGMLLSRELYARSRADYKDPYFSPLNSTAKDDPSPTPALLLLAGRDGLLDDGTLYAKHLSELGGEARCIIYERSYHAFMNGLGDSDAADDAYEEIVNFIFAR